MTRPDRKIQIGPSNLLVRYCPTCDTGTLNHTSWAQLDDAGKAKARELADVTSARKKGAWCHKHLSRLRRNGDPLALAPYTARPPRGSAWRSREEVLEEWEMLRNDGTTDLLVAAGRMGMSFSALDMALYRARKAGDPRGVVIRNDDLGSERTSTGRHSSRRTA